MEAVFGKFHFMFKQNFFILTFPSRFHFLAHDCKHLLLGKQAATPKHFFSAMYGDETKKSRTKVVVYHRRN